MKNELLQIKINSLYKTQLEEAFVTSLTFFDFFFLWLKVQI